MTHELTPADARALHALAQRARELAAVLTGRSDAESLANYADELETTASVSAFDAPPQALPRDRDVADLAAAYRLAEGSEATDFAQ